MYYTILLGIHSQIGIHALRTNKYNKKGFLEEFLSRANKEAARFVAHDEA